jgi:hypothetical protein
MIALRQHYEALVLCGLQVSSRNDAICGIKGSGQPK